MSLPTQRAARSLLVGAGEMDLHTRDMTATFAADLTLGAAQRALARIGQWIPIDGHPDQTLGALIDDDSTGPLRLGYGAWRDLLLGAQFINGKGELITAGGRTVKNVAGYDLTKFMVGQGGVFGRLMTITTRTYRQPQGALLAIYRDDLSRVTRIIPTPLRPQWMLLAPGALRLGYLADEETLAFYRQKLADEGVATVESRTLDADIEDRFTSWRADGDKTFRASLPPARLADFVKSAASSSWVADAAFGVMLGNADDDGELARARTAAKELGGSLRVRHASGGLVEVTTNAVERRILKRLKDAFDPDHTLGPLPWRKES